MSDEKISIVQEVLKQTNAAGDKHFDKLYDKETTYLNKLLKVINRLRNANK